jgi:pilus assembly protein CpaB
VAGVNLPQGREQVYMKKNNLVTLLGIALVVAIVSTGIFYGLFVSKLSSNAGNGKSLIVAAKPLKAGTILTDADVKSIPWPAEQLPKGAFEQTADVTGKTLFDGIGEDEPVLASRLASSDHAGNAAVPAGMRAVSVHVADSSGVIALLHAGHRVDVQVVRKSAGSSTEVRTALQNLQVFSVIPQAEQSSQGSSLPVVTLLAKPNEADILAAADAGAQVRLALRNPLDHETGSRSALSVDAVMRTSGAAAR